jgi:hypothetical protein
MGDKPGRIPAPGTGYGEEFYLVLFWSRIFGLAATVHVVRQASAVLNRGHSHVSILNRAAFGSGPFTLKGRL